VVVMRARPGRVHAEHAIAAPSPRDSLFRTSAGYAQLCREVSASLEAASRAEAA
jgi:NitT/TauT family transport system ATP-binding protein